MLTSFWVAVADKIQLAKRLLSDIAADGPKAWNSFAADPSEVMWYLGNVQWTAEWRLGNIAAVRRLDRLVEDLRNSAVPVECTPVDGYEVIEEVDWPAHPWLGDMDGGTDIDADSARFWIVDDADTAAALRQILFQFKTDVLDWQDAVPAAGGIFPGHSSMRGLEYFASAGYYAPIWDYLNPRLYANTQWRALIPEGWTCPVRE